MSNKGKEVVNQPEETTIPNNPFVKNLMEDKEIPEGLKTPLVKAFVWKNTYEFVVDSLEIILNHVLDDKNISLSHEIEFLVDNTFDYFYTQVAIDKHYPIEKDSFTKYWMCSYINTIFEAMLNHRMDIFMPKRIKFLHIPTEEDRVLFKNLSNGSFTVGETDWVGITLEEKEFTDITCEESNFSLDSVPPYENSYEEEFKAILAKDTPVLEKEILGKIVQYTFATRLLMLKEQFKGEEFDAE